MTARHYGKQRATDTRTPSDDTDESKSNATTGTSCNTGDECREIEEMACTPVNMAKWKKKKKQNCETEPSDESPESDDAVNESKRNAKQINIAKALQAQSEMTKPPSSPVEKEKWTTKKKALTMTVVTAIIWLVVAGIIFGGVVAAGYL